jgi:hypothetical protein
MMMARSSKDLKKTNVLIYLVDSSRTTVDLIMPVLLLWPLLVFVGVIVDPIHKRMVRR